MKRLIVLAVLVFILGLISYVSGGDWTPLPEDLNIKPAGPDIDKKIADYLGIWEGQWDNSRAVTIVIEQISPSEVIAIYSYGPLDQNKGGWVRVIGRITKDNSVELAWKGRVVTLFLNSPRIAFAEFRRQVILRATLHKK